MLLMHISSFFLQLFGSEENMDASNIHLLCFFLMPGTVGHTFLKVK
jgi:hypothetical protein